MRDLPRVGRRAAVTGALFGMAAMAAGCGSQGSGSRSSSGASRAGTGTAGEVEKGAYPVTLKHQYGSTTITEKPRRVVVVGLMEQDALIALGTTPVAVTNWFGNAPGRIFDWAKPTMGDAPLPAVLGSESPQFEKVAALNPDLIIGLYSNMKKSDYERYSQLAPTVAHQAGQNDFAISWQEITSTVGKAMGRPAKAKELISGVEDRFARARKNYPQFQGKEGLMAGLYEGIYVYGPQDPRSRIMKELGFTFPKDLEFTGKSSFGKSISAERAGLVDVDVLVWIYGKKKVVREVPTYRTLRLAKEKRSVFIPENDDDMVYIATSFVTVLSLPFLLDHLLPKLAAAVDGDPRTPVP